MRMERIRAFVSVLGGLVLVPACSAKQSFPLVVPGSGRSIGGVYIDAEVRLTLVEKGSALVIGHRDPILPLQAVQQLYYTNGKSIRCLPTFAELKGLVAISTPNQALKYVQLRTSPMTWYLWKSETPMMYLVPTSESRSRNRHIPAPTIKRIKDGFVVSRSVLIG